MNPRDPIEELHDTKLYKFLAGSDEDFARRITSFVREVAPILASVPEYFPFYTRHDAHHGFRVTRRIAQIISARFIDADAPERFMASEVYLLIAASYAHDLGMAVFPGEEIQLLADLHLTPTERWKNHPDLQNYLRKHHSTRGGKYVSQHARRLEVPQSLIAPLDWLMKSHNLAIAALESELRLPFAAEEQPLDILRLAAVFCIADAIEFSETRVIDGVLESLSGKLDPAARLSYLENLKHFSVGDGLAIDEHGRIIVSGTFDDPDALSFTHYTFDQIESWVREYCDIERRSRRSCLRVHAEPFNRRLELSGAHFERLGVRLNKTNIINLIASDAVWQSEIGLPVRELIQNAVEACRYRAYRSRVGEHYSPQIKVEFDRAAHTVTVSDNGCGMTQRVVINHFLTVGNTRARDAGYGGENYFPIARFGIGFWSVFTICDLATVETLALEQAEDSAGTGNGIRFNVSIDDLKDYTVFRELPLTIGTKIVLQLKKSIAIDDLIHKTRAQIVCSPVELNFVFDGNVDSISKEVPKVTEKDVLEERLSVKEEYGVEIFSWRGNLNETELALAFAYRVEREAATFLLADGSWLSQAVPQHFNPKTAICGFYIPIRSNAICFDLTRIGAYFANCQTPKGFEYSVNRRGLLPNEASQIYSREIAALIHDGYRKFLRTVNSYTPASIYRLNQQSRLGGGNVYDQFTGPELGDACDYYPDLLCFQLYELDPARTFRNAETRSVDVNGLRAMQGTVLFIQNASSQRVSAGQSRMLRLDHPNFVDFSYDLLKTIVVSRSFPLPAFMVENNRQASMLFDNDPDSTVFFTLSNGLPIAVQSVNLSNVSFDRLRKDILVDVTGSWAGLFTYGIFPLPMKNLICFLEGTDC